MQELSPLLLRIIHAYYVLQEVRTHLVVHN